MTPTPHARTGDSGADGWGGGDRRVQIPTDIDRPDRLLAGLTARQLSWLIAGALAGYLLLAAGRRLAPLPVVAGVAALPLLLAALLAFAGRDGLSGDQLIGAALAQWRRPARLVAAPSDPPPLPGWARALLDANSDSRAAAGWGLPVHTISDSHTDPGTDPRQAGTADGADARLPAHEVPPFGLRPGVVDLGSDGSAVLAAASCVNFTLRSPREQDALTAAFGRFLNAADRQLQILLRSHPLDARPLADRLRHAAGALPHPALERAAREHADYLEQLASQPGVRQRQALLVLRDPDPPATAGPLLVGRLADAATALARAGITLRPLSAGAAAAVLAQAADPTTEPAADLAAAHAPAGGAEVITAEPTGSAR